MRVAGMGSMRPSTNMVGPRLLLKPNILTMGKPKAPIFITNLGLVPQFKPLPNAIMGKPKTHLHHKLGPGAPTQAQIHFHQGQAQGTHSSHSPLLRLGITFGRSFLSPAWREAKWSLSGKGREARVVGEDGGDDYGWLIEEVAMRAGYTEGEVSRRFVNVAHAAKM